MSASQIGTASERRSPPAWHAALPPFRVPAGRPLRDAVLADMHDMMRARGEFPSPARYTAAVDPVRDAAIAEELVACALELAPRAAGALALAWRRCFPAWSTAIDRATAASALLEGLDDAPDADEADLQATASDGGAPPGAGAHGACRLGPPLPDGLGRYEPIERIGAGSGGTVFRATDHALSQCGAPVVVAIKVIDCPHDEVDARLREAGAARAVSHSAVARVLDAGVVARASAVPADASRAASIFIASEYIDGQPLYLWKAMHPARTAEECAAIALALVEALGHCHGEGVAHGDISPANVLVDASGAARIIDFGLAAWRTTDGVGTEALGKPDALDARVAHDLRRVRALMEWMVRDLPPTRQRRAALDAVHRRCDGRPARWRMGVGSAAALAATGMAVVAAGVAILLDARRPPDPVDLLFGDALSQRPDLVELARDLLDDGRPTLWSSEVTLSKVRALRDEATMARRAGAPSAELELLASLAALLTPERPYARTFAALAVDGRIGADEGARASLDTQSLRRELAWAIVFGLENVPRDAQPDDWSRVEALGGALGAPGLLPLVRGDTVVRPRVPADSPERRRGQPAGAGAGDAGVTAEPGGGAAAGAAVAGDATPSSARANPK